MFKFNSDHNKHVSAHESLSLYKKPPDDLLFLIWSLNLQGKVIPPAKVTLNYSFSSGPGCFGSDLLQQNTFIYSLYSVTDNTFDLSALSVTVLCLLPYVDFLGRSHRLYLDRF